MNLTFTPFEEAPELVTANMADFIRQQGLAAKVAVAEIDPAFADGALLSEHYQIPIEMEVNCLVVEGRRGERVTYAAVLVPYGMRANTASPIMRALDASKVTFANLDFVLDATQMEFGAINPLGLPADWLVLMEPRLLEQEELVLGGGYAHSKILMKSQDLAALEQVALVENLAK